MPLNETNAGLGFSGSKPHSQYRIRLAGSPYAGIALSLKANFLLSSTFVLGTRAQIASRDAFEYGLATGGKIVFQRTLHFEPDRDIFSKSIKENKMHEQVSKALLLYGSIAAAVGVALGAWGTHGLKTMASAEHVATFETAVRYQMYHAFALIAAGLSCQAYQTTSPNMFKTVGWLWGAGILLFCGSLYLLVLLNISWLGMVTPLGGLAFIAGWTAFAATVARRA